MVETAKSIRPGDPLDPSKLGALVESGHRDRVSYIAKGQAEGGAVLGGERPETDLAGCYVNQAIFADVKNSMAIAQEEIFCPDGPCPRS